MLVLGRTPGEAILIGSDIEVVVLAVSGNQVHIGVTAPRKVAVWRKELVVRPGESSTSGVSRTPQTQGAGRSDRR